MNTQDDPTHMHGVGAIRHVMVFVKEHSRTGATPIALSSFSHVSGSGIVDARPRKIVPVVVCPEVAPHHMRQILAAARGTFRYGTAGMSRQPQHEQQAQPALKLVSTRGEAHDHNTPLFLPPESLLLSSLYTCRDSTSTCIVKTVKPYPYPERVYQDMREERRNK